MSWGWIPGSFGWPHSVWSHSHHHTNYLFQQRKYFMPFWDSKQGSADPTCSFCGRAQNAVSGFIQSLSKYTCGTCRTDSTLLICNECVQLCGRFLAEHSPNTTEPSSPPQDFTLPRPPEIKAILDQYVVGQEQAKKVLAVAVHNH